MRELAKRSDYEYKIYKDYILIVDLDMGGMSVTNNIENIIEQICFENNLDPNDMYCLYKDSCGDIDGYNYRTNQFFILSDRLNKLFEKRFIK